MITIDDLKNICLREYLPFMRMQGYNFSTYIDYPRCRHILTQLMERQYDDNLTPNLGSINAHKFTFQLSNIVYNGKNTLGYLENYSLVYLWLGYNEFGIPLHYEHDLMFTADDFLETIKKIYGEHSWQLREALYLRKLPRYT